MSDDIFVPLETVMVPIEKLIPYARNARTHSKEQVKELAASIREFKFRDPVEVADDFTIIAGHGRVLALELLGAKQVPCVVHGDMTKSQWRAYNIINNNSTDKSSWDLELLSAELGELQLDFDFGELGVELEKFLKPEDGGTGTGEGGDKKKLSDRFGIAPFSILNAREGWWQERKRSWLALGIKSELGRGENGFDAAPGGSPMVAGYGPNGERLTGLANIGKSKK